MENTPSNRIQSRIKTFTRKLKNKTLWSNRIKIG
jgi:hypothetical protein